MSDCKEYVLQQILPGKKTSYSIVSDIGEYASWTAEKKQSQLIAVHCLLWLRRSDVGGGTADQSNAGVGHRASSNHCRRRRRRRRRR